VDGSNIRTTNVRRKVLLSVFSLGLSRYMSACVSQQRTFVVKSLFPHSLAAAISACPAGITESEAEDRG